MSTRECSSNNAFPRHYRLHRATLAACAVLVGALAIGTAIGYPSMAIESMRGGFAVPSDGRFDSKGAGFKTSQRPFLKTAVAQVAGDSDRVAWFNSIMALTALPGAFVAGVLSMSAGRRVTLLLASGPFALGWLTIALTYAVTARSAFVQLMIGRAMTGFCTGMMCVAGPLYIVEVASRSRRGFLGGLFGSIISGGILVSGVLGGLLLDWRRLAFFNIIFPVLTALLLGFTPQSPKFLVSKQRFDEAADAIRLLHGSKYDVSHEISFFKQQIENSRFSSKDLIAKESLKAYGIAACLMLFQNFSGMNAVMMYAVPILQKAAPSVNSIYLTIALQGIQVLVNTAASAATNRMGRRPPLLFSSFTMFLSLGAFGYLEFSKVSNPVELPVVACLSAVVGYAVGFGPLPWLVVAEIAPIKVTGVVSAVATATNWATFFILIRTFDSLVRALGLSSVFWLYSACCFLALIFTLVCLPETSERGQHRVKCKADEHSVQPVTDGEIAVFSKGNVQNYV